MKSNIYKQIKNIALILRDKSLQVSENFPCYTSDNKGIIWENFQDIAFQYKDRPYEEIYQLTKEKKDYNFRMFDDAIIQMKYSFRNQNIIKHVLSYLPNPNLENFQDDRTEYEERFYGDKLFTDMIEKKIVVFPIRFDYSEDWTDCEHPKSHATFGNYIDCRIPISSPISPKNFILFILRSFYFEKFKESFTDEINKNAAQSIDSIQNDKRYNKTQKEKEVLRVINEHLNNMFRCDLQFDKTISENEKKLIHFNIE